MRCLQGWVIDAQMSESGNSMDVWILSKGEGMKLISVPWTPHIHVCGERRRLAQLEDWIKLSEISSRFSVGSTRFVKKRLSLDEYEMHDVLEINVLNSRNMRKLAEHIESKGGYNNFDLYSVDAHLAQRFFIEYNIAPFDFVKWNNGFFSKLKNETEWPDMKSIDLRFEYSSDNGFHSTSSRLVRIIISEGVDFTTNYTRRFTIENNISDRQLIEDLNQKITQLNPDIVTTNGGDALHFNFLENLSRKEGIKLNLNRKDLDLNPRTMSRVVHSYGQVIRKDAYFPLSGRLHIDFKASFIVREGGILGLFELSKHSRQSPQDISRLSPGSVISAIQMRIAMEDNVLVPWKKNRSEDTKTAWELMVADRGGLYLDSKPGVYSDVIELDFASLFPSIIATRNISPETLNCACCQATNQAATTENYIPLHPDEADLLFRKRKRSAYFASKLFPVTSQSALRVPELKTHTCAKVRGFLGRVVSPIIERRRILKSKVVQKGDSYDLQQNALKWLLVTCFGYTGYKNARFGRIEAHEAICAWAREILLTTIEAAQDDGWTVLHAIVDCVWIHNPKIESREDKIAMARDLAKRLTTEIGIPLEFEDIYDFIGFLPSRIHGSGSLTKYWAYGRNGLKVRGIEARQHSTCVWIKGLQERALEIIVQECDHGEGLQSKTIQTNIVKLLHEQLELLHSNKISANNLVITKRVSKTIEEFRVNTDTKCALMRAKDLGQDITPGRKVNFVVTKSESNLPKTRVILAEELGFVETVIPNLSYYTGLAKRAIWAILGPFGWSDEEILSGRKITTLLDFSSSLISQSTMDDSTC